MSYNAAQFGLKPELLQSICALAQRYNVEKLLIFGSRARGTYRERSDIDLAAKGGNVSAFALDVEDETPTLLKFDVVNLNCPISDELQTELKRDGVLIYEKI